MNDSPDLRPALAYLKAVASDDYEAIRVLTDHGDLLELVEGLADLLLLFIGDLSDNPSHMSTLCLRRSTRRRKEIGNDVVYRGADRDSR
jgi:hypothetical protein